MATNDVNLQVINSMTQAKMNSLKDADGKIPSLANQIIMTDEEDTSLSQFRTEPIYDMYSNDDNLNKNRKTGIFSGTWNVFTIDAKYSGIRVYACLANKHTVFDCDLDLIKNGTVSEVTATGISKNQNTSGNNAYMLYGCNITIGSNLSFTVREIFAYNGVADSYSSYTSSDTTYFVYKVEGILKEPAMIYTGAELHEGNGISIENGVVGIVPAQAVALNTTRSGQNDTVVEYAVTDSGNTWYRKWASGWKECGGTVAGIANGGDTVTLPVSFSTLKFTVIVVVSNAVGSEGTGGFGGNFPGGNVVTYNKIRIDKYPQTTYPHNYYCCGF